MDIGDKGLISNSIDRAIEQKDIIDRASWAVEAVKTQHGIKPVEKELQMPIEVLGKMLTLAYVLGSTLSSIVDEIVHERYGQKVDEWLYNRWASKFGTDKADKMLAEKILRETKTSEKTKPLKIEFTEEDLTYIREKLASVAQQLKVKIDQELALKKAKSKY